MGKVMGQLKAKAQGRADMGQLSALVKAKLAEALACPMAPHGRPHSPGLRLI